MDRILSEHIQSIDPKELLEAMTEKQYKFIAKEIVTQLKKQGFNTASYYEKLMSKWIKEVERELIEEISNIAYYCRNNACYPKGACLNSPCAASCEKWQQLKQSRGIE
jgi:hypothetical protein